jgi:hypothetical protein
LEAARAGGKANDKADDEQLELELDSAMSVTSM